jgi:Flagellar motor protein
MTDLQTVPDEPLRPAATQASRLLATAFVSRAAAAARDGRLDDAEPLIAEALIAQRSIEALDLLARIRAQQGRLLEAEAAWSEALRNDPNCDAAQAGLRRIRSMQTRRVPLWPLIVAAAVVVTVLVVELRRIPAPAPPPVELKRPATAAPKQPVAEAPVIQLAAIPGVILRREKDEVIATFEASVFSHGATLTKEGKSLLASLGRQIEAHAGTPQLIIEGHCDRNPLRDGSAYDDNTALGLARSDAVFRYLRQTTHLPNDAFSLRTLGSDAPPFADPERNRTVVIRIRPQR